MLTLSSLQAGALAVVSRCLLAESAEEGQLKVHAWLLCTLTASHLSAAVRSAVAASQPVLRRLTEMLHCDGVVTAGVGVWGGCGGAQGLQGKRSIAAWPVSQQDV